jgi:hypothetical protein
VLLLFVAAAAAATSCAARSVETVEDRVEFGEDYFLGSSD